MFTAANLASNSRRLAITDGSLFNADPIDEVKLDPIPRPYQHLSEYLQENALDI